MLSERREKVERKKTDRREVDPIRDWEQGNEFCLDLCVFRST
jgi:hypothetical protein